MPAQRIEEFDTWRPGYGGASVAVYIAGTQTLADIYSDEALTVVAVNPQMLERRTIDGFEYGKFNVPLYTEQPYYCLIDNADNTGVVRPPLVTLDDQESGESVLTPTSGTRERTLEDLLGQEFYAENYGEIGVSAATNTVTIAAALGAAAAVEAGTVYLPAGDIQFNQLSIPGSVVLSGKGKDATTLISTVAGNAVTFAGDSAGLANLTLDGSTLVSSSVGVYSKANNETVFENVLLKRFATSLYVKGGRRNNWRNLFIDNSAVGAQLYGDLDTGNGSDGDEWRDNLWLGGLVTNCTTKGVELKYVDKKAWHNSINHVGFENNTGTALSVNGARSTNLDGSWFSGNVTNFAIADGAVGTTDDDKVVGFTMEGGSIVEGEVTITGTAQDIVLDGVELTNVEFTLTAPENDILLRDCIESGVTISGTGTRLTRNRNTTGESPSTSGLTTNNVATKAWSFKMVPGQVVIVHADVIAVARNTADYSVYTVRRAARRPGSELDFDAQTANFTNGDTITGATSGATGLLISNTDAGATGTLVLRNIAGEFIDNEIVTGALGGSATADGTLTHAAVALLGTHSDVAVYDPADLTAVVVSTIESDTDFAVTFVATNEEVEIHVAGDTSKTVEWTVSARVISS